jgi:predicted nucleotidyltransferase
MKPRQSPAKRERATRWYWGADVPQRLIRRFARQVAERFHPDKIILFGSYAYGQPDADSDVDILVVMPARNELDQAVRIRLAVEAPFAVDLLVRTPKNLAWRLKEGDWFLREVMARGKVLYAKDNRRMGAQSRARLPGRRKAGQNAVNAANLETEGAQSSAQSGEWP